MPRRLRDAVFLSVVCLAVAGCSRGVERRHAEPGTKWTTGESASPESSAPIRGKQSPQIPYDDVPEDEPVIHRSAAGNPDADGWCVAESTRGNMSVELPGRFVDLMLKSTATTGGTGVFHTVATILPDGTEFNALDVEIIGECPPAMGGSPESMIARFEKEGASVKRRKVTVAELPADRLSVSAPGVSAEMLLISTPSDKYMLAVQWHPPVRDHLDEDIERFFSSFRITSEAE